MPVALRPFQADLERRIYEAWHAGAVNVMPVAATGSGKTVLLSKLLYDEPGASVAIAHRQELVSQISVALARNGVRHRLVGAKKGAPLIRVISSLHIAELGHSFFDPNAKTGVGGVDTIIRMDEGDPWFKQVRLMVQDEAHHVLKANKWGQAASMFPNARGLLPTATPLRADGKGLGRHADGLVDAMVLAPSMRDIINMGYLTDYRIFAPPSDLDLSQVAMSQATGDFNADQLRKAVHKSHITGDVVAHYLKLARGKLGVTFAVDVEAATEIAGAFRAAGVPAEVVSAKTPDARREWSLDRRERRSSGKSDAIPMRVCVNPECIQPYERIYKCCPYCGHYPPPPARSAPEFVDGDLTELDAETLVALRGEIARIDGDPVIPYGATPEVAGAVRKRHWERRQAQVALRNVIAWWAGLEAAQGRGESESYRRFYFKFGVDVANAQTLGTREAEELTARVHAELAKVGIDGTVNADVYFAQNQ